jgi:hypothetical protein
MRSFTKVIASCLALISLSVTAVNAANVGYYTDNNNGTNSPATAITGAGHTATKINDITTFDFSGIDMLFIDESNNGGLSAGMSGRLTDIGNWVNGGGKLIVHDRFVAPSTTLTSNPFLVGGSGIQVSRDFTSNLDTIPPSNPVINGPFGTIGDTDLDGGNFSAHGYAADGTLPGGSHKFLNWNGDNNKVVSFDYGYGSGLVFYSTIPLDFYLDGAGNNPPRDNLNNIYTKNVLAYAGNYRVDQNVSHPSEVPEPMSMATMGLGLPLLGWFRRRRSA